MIVTAKDLDELLHHQGGRGGVVLLAQARRLPCRDGARLLPQASCFQRVFFGGGEEGNMPPTQSSGFGPVPPRSTGAHLPYSKLSLSPLSFAVSPSTPLCLVTIGLMA